MAEPIKLNKGLTQTAKSQVSKSNKSFRTTANFFKLKPAPSAKLIDRKLDPKKLLHVRPLFENKIQHRENKVNPHFLPSRNRDQ